MKKEALEFLERSRERGLFHMWIKDRILEACKDPEFKDKLTEGGKLASTIQAELLALKIVEKEFGGSYK